MLSAASTVTVFCLPATGRLLQCPVITTVLESPLMVTTLSLQAIVRFSPMPEIVRLVLGDGAGDVDGADADVDGAAVLVRVLGGAVLRGLLVAGLEVPDMLGAELMV